MHAIVTDGVICKIQLLELPSLKSVREGDDCIDTKSEGLQVERARILNIPTQKVFFEELSVLHYISQVRVITLLQFAVSPVSWQRALNKSVCS